MWSLLIAEQSLLKVGPLVLTGEISLPSLVAAGSIVYATIKLVQHLSRVNDQVTQLWNAIMGTGPQDEKSLFSRFKLIEFRVDQIWRRLKFDRLSAPRSNGEDT